MQTPHTPSAHHPRIGWRTKVQSVGSWFVVYVDAWLRRRPSRTPYQRRLVGLQKYNLPPVLQILSQCGEPKVSGLIIIENFIENLLVDQHHIALLLDSRLYQTVRLIKILKVCLLAALVTLSRERVKDRLISS
jgi:hypothetical protein